MENDEIEEIEEERLPIEVRIAQIHGRKRITVIKNVPADARVKLLKTLKTFLGCGGCIDKEDGFVQLQGDYSATIAEKLKVELPDYKIVVGGKK